MKRSLFFLPLAAVLGLAVGLAVMLATGGNRSSITSSEQKPIPSFRVSTLSSPSVLSDATLSSRNLPAIVNFFASWCAPCLIEHPLLMNLAKRSDLRLYGIAWRDRTEDTRAWLSRHGNPFSLVGKDEDSKAAIEWGVTGVPETFFIDSHNRIVFVHRGPLTDASLSEGLQAFDLRP